MSAHGLETGMLVRITRKPKYSNYPSSELKEPVVVPVRVDGDWVFGGENDEWTIWAKSLRKFNVPNSGWNPNYTFEVVTDY